MKKGERNSENGCWLERELEALKGEDSRVMITRESRWEFQRLFFPYHADLTLFVRSWRPVLHYIRAILQEITYGKVSRGPMTKDFGPTAGNQPETLKPVRESKN